MVRQAILAALLLALAACAGGPGGSGGQRSAANCGLIRIAELPVTITKNRQLLIPVGLNGQTVMMQVDTGASQSVVYDGAVKAIGLKPRIVPNVKMIGVNGETSMYEVEMTGFALGENIHAEKSFSVAVIGTKQWTGKTESIGLLGGDYLKHFDVEFDLEHRLINLFAHHPCADQAAYWPHDILLTAKFQFGTLPRSQEPSSDIMIPIEINGQLGKAILDSGAAITAMTWHSARDFGITPETEGVRPGDAMHGIGDRSVEAVVYRIPSVKFGDEIISNIPTKIYRPVVDPTTRQMLFGVDFLLKNRVYIAYEERELYFTPYHYRMAPGAEDAAAAK
jgi:predicted aspartyl protease